MAAVELSVSFDSETIQRARRAAARAGLSLSSWIDRAVRREADLDEARVTLDAHLAEYGEPTETSP